MRLKFGLLGLVLLASSIGVAKLCSTKSTGKKVSSHETQPDDFVPYPWGTELPFPWIKVQGLWSANVGNLQAYYTFEVVRQNELSEKQLLIKQYDLRTCEILAIGVGIENDHKTIWAHMKVASQAQSYRLGLRNFSADKLPKNLPSDEGRVMVMSVSSIGSLKLRYYPMQKLPVTSAQRQNCEWLR